jgi:hypothetical protein
VSTPRSRALANAARTRRDDPEHRVHVRAVAELRASFVRRGIWSGAKEDACPFFHAMNEGDCSNAEAEKRRALGVSSGVSDLVIVVPTAGVRLFMGDGHETRSYPGLANEIKAPGGKLSRKQEQWLAFWSRAGFLSKVTTGHRETAELYAAVGYIEREAAHVWIAWAERCDPGAL